jgi:hypothetical protein
MMKNTYQYYRNLPVILLAAVLLSSFSVSAKTGTYVLDWEGAAPPNSTIHILATSHNGLTYSEFFEVSGMSSGQAANLIKADLQLKGWYVQQNAPHEVSIWGRIAGSSFDAIGTHYATSSLAEGALINSYLRGYTMKTSETVVPREFVFTFTPPILDPDFSSTLSIKLNGFGQSVDLEPGATAPQFAAALENALMSFGYDVTAAEGQVSLDWSHPANYDLLGEMVQLEIGVMNGAGGPHVTVAVPDEAIVSDLGMAAYSYGETVFSTSGGELKYYLGIGNDGSGAVDGWLWREVTSQNGEIVNSEEEAPLYYSLAALTNVSEDRVLDVPANLPEGAYTLTTYFGAYDQQDPENMILTSREIHFTVQSDQETVPWIGERGYISPNVHPIELPGRQRLLSGFPNPFNPETSLTFDLAQSGQVSLVVYDVSGREVLSLLNGYYDAGQHQAIFNGQNLPSGVYFARLSAASQVQTTKLMLVK